MNRWSTTLMVGCLLAVGVVAAQEAVPSQRADDLVDWAPSWEIGDWWLVKVYQPYVDVDSAEARPPSKRPGVPEGFEPSNRILYRVIRRELVSYESDPEGTEPEAFTVIQARSLDGLRTRNVELWYTEEDLSLAKVVFNGKQTRGMLTGTAQLDVAESGSLGAPLEWPDFRAAKKPEAKVFGHHGARLEQETKKDGARIRVRLSAPKPTQQKRRLAAPPGAEKKNEALVDFEWRGGLPSWKRVRTRSRYAEMVRHGKAGDLPRRLRNER